MEDELLPDEDFVVEAEPDFAVEVGFADDEFLSLSDSSIVS